MGSVTGDTPQPGETPRNEGEPWSYTDPGAPWWRVSPDRKSSEALADAAAHPRQNRPRPATPGPMREDSEPAFAPEALDAHAAGVQDLTEALNPKTDEGYAESVPKGNESPLPELLNLSDRTPGVPDIMVLPEPLRDRPTVALDREAGPDRLRVRAAQPDQIAGHAGGPEPGPGRPDREFAVLADRRGAGGGRQRLAHPGAP